MDEGRRAVATPVPAASVLLVRDTPLEVLLVRRSAGAVFSSALVFPGGVVDSHDASEDWLPHVAGAELLETTERSFRIVVPKRNDRSDNSSRVVQTLPALDRAPDRDRSGRRDGELDGQYR